MFPVPFDLIDKAAIDQLIESRVEEGRALDYKAALPGSSNGERKEFAADVSSFANATGGYLVYGVSEEKDAEGKNTGFPKAAEGLPVNGDQECLRLEQMARANIDPPIPGLRVKAVPDFSGGSVIVLHVPRSWAAPHMVRAEDSRFHSRGNKGKHSLSITEIRAAFVASAEMPERIRRFRDQRLGRIISGDTPVPLRRGLTVVLHMIPHASMSPEAAIDLHAWSDRGWLVPMGNTTGLWNGYFNSDGFVTFTGKGLHRSYMQVFRSGAIESVATTVLHEADGTTSREIRPSWVEEEVVKAVDRYLQLMRRHDVEAPVSLLTTILGVKGGTLPPASRFFDDDDEPKPPPPANDELLLPDVVIKHQPITSVPTTLRPVFDALWQAFGVARSRHYDDAGTWIEEAPT